MRTTLLCVNIYNVHERSNGIICARFDLKQYDHGPDQWYKLKNNTFRCVKYTLLNCIRAIEILIGSQSCEVVLYVRTRHCVVCRISSPVPTGTIAKVDGNKLFINWSKVSNMATSNELSPRFGAHGLPLCKGVPEGPTSFPLLEDTPGLRKQWPTFHRAIAHYHILYICKKWLTSVYALHIHDLSLSLSLSLMAIAILFDYH